MKEYPKTAGLLVAMAEQYIPNLFSVDCKGNDLFSDEFKKMVIMDMFRLYDRYMNNIGIEIEFKKCFDEVIGLGNYNPDMEYYYSTKLIYKRK